LRKFICMKAYVLVLLLLLFYRPASAQWPEVSVSNWRGTALFIVSDYWDPVEPQLKDKVSDSLLLQIKKRCTQSNWPSLFQFPTNSNAEEKQKALLNVCKKYLIATYDNIRNGNNYGTYGIIYLPVAENRQHYPGNDWQEDIYMLVPMKDVTVLKK